MKSATKFGWLRLTLIGVSKVALGIVSITIIAGFFGEYAQVFELMSHFRIVYLLISVPLLLVLLLSRSWKWALLFVIPVLLNAFQFLPFYLKASPNVLSEAGPGEDLRVLQINLWGPRNTRHSEMVAFVKDKSPDILGVSELTETWERVLSTALPEYKYRVCEKRFGGIALYSRLPLTNPRIIYYGAIKRPRVEAEIMLDAQPVKLVMAHPVVPKEKYAIRNGELEEIGSTAGSAKMPVVLFGDLNCSPWSFYFEKLLKDGKLQDTSRGFGLQPTWTTKWLHPLIPIDHCLVSSQFKTIERIAGPSVGSDHLPVYAKIRLRTGSCKGSGD